MKRRSILATLVSTLPLAGIRARAAGRAKAEWGPNFIPGMETLYGGRVYSCPFGKTANYSVHFSEPKRTHAGRVWEEYRMLPLNPGVEEDAFVAVFDSERSYDEPVGRWRERAKAWELEADNRERQGRGDESPALRMHAAYFREVARKISERKTE